MTDLLEVRSIAVQLIHQAIQRIDADIAAGHIADTMDDNADVDTLALAAEEAAHAATVHLTWEQPRTWQIQQDGNVLHTVTDQSEAQTIALLLIRTETGDHTVNVRWVCAVCDSEDDTCPACWDGTPQTLFPRGILTEATYEIVRVDA